MYLADKLQFVTFIDSLIDIKCVIRHMCIYPCKVRSFSDTNCVCYKTIRVVGIQDKSLHVVLLWLRSFRKFQPSHFCALVGGGGGGQNSAVKSKIFVNFH